MTQEEARRTKKPAAALETARLIRLLEKSHRVIDRGEASRDHLVTLRLARDEAITRLIRLNAQVAEISATQRKVVEATRQLERELALVNANGTH